MSYRLTAVQLSKRAQEIAKNTPLKGRGETVVEARRAILAERIHQAMYWAINTDNAGRYILDKPTNWGYHKLPWWRGGGYAVTHRGCKVAWCRFAGTAHGLVNVMRYEEPDVDWSQYARPG